MKRVLGTVLGVSAVLATVGAQEQPTDVTIRTKVNLVLMQVVVTQHGAAVKGLAEKDFSLFSDGRLQKTAVFEEIDAVSAKPELPSLAADTVQNYVPGDSHQDLSILLLDFLNAGFTTSLRIRESLKDIARELAASRTPVTVLMLSPKGLFQMHSFTSDPDNLVKAVEQWSSGASRPDSVSGQPSFGDIPEYSSVFAPTEAQTAELALRKFAQQYDSIQTIKLDKAAMTLQAIEQVGETFRGVPGRKKLIWISTGFPQALTFDKPLTDLSAAQTEFQIREKSDRAWRSLSDANITVYPIDSNGVTNPNMRLHSLGPVEQETFSNVSSLLEVAQKTGGQNCDLAPARCVRLAQADGAHYYLLGFYLENGSKPGWHKLKVNVDQPHLAVRGRDGYIVAGESDPKKAADHSQDAVLTALASPLDYTSIPLKLHWTTALAESADAQVELAVASPPGGISFRPEDGYLNVDFLAFVRPVGQTEGRSIPAPLVTKLSSTQQRNLETVGFLFRKRISLAPGRYQVRVLLRDNLAKKMGTVSTSIEIAGARKPGS